MTSAHKTLPAWSQAAIVLARVERIDAARLDAAFEATAPDEPGRRDPREHRRAVVLLEGDGTALLGRLIDLMRHARQALAGWRDWSCSTDPTSTP